MVRGRIRTRNDMFCSKYTTPFSEKPTGFWRKEQQFPQSHYKRVTAGMYRNNPIVTV